VDELPFPLDSRAYQGNLSLLSGFNKDHRLVYFNGSPKDATFETPEIRLITNSRTQLNTFRVEVQGNSDTSITARVGTRNNTRENVNFGPVLSERANGDFKTSASGFFHRILITITGGFERAVGVDVIEAVNRGSR